MDAAHAEIEKADVVVTQMETTLEATCRAMELARQSNADAAKRAIIIFNPAVSARKQP